jgi:hypothetical protein
MRLFSFLVIALCASSFYGQSADYSGSVRVVKPPVMHEQKLDHFSIVIPDCVVLEKKKGIEGSGWVFETSDFNFTVFQGERSPKATGYERSLTSFTRRNQMIDGESASIWKYENPAVRLRYVAALRIAPSNQPFQTFTIYIRSTSSDLHTLAESIFASIKLNKGIPKSRFQVSSLVGP